MHRENDFPVSKLNTPNRLIQFHMLRVADENCRETEARFLYKTWCQNSESTGKQNNNKLPTKWSPCNGSKTSVVWRTWEWTCAPSHCRHSSSWGRPCGPSTWTWISYCWGRWGPPHCCRPPPPWNPRPPYHHGKHGARAAALTVSARQMSILRCSLAEACSLWTPCRPSRSWRRELRKEKVGARRKERRRRGVDGRAGANNDARDVPLLSFYRSVDAHSVA